jgi:putative peptidoglycan lipid II flippase
VNAGLLGAALSWQGLFKLDERSRARLPRIILSALAMGGLLLGGNLLLQDNYAPGAGFLAAAWGLLALVSAGVVSYFAIAHLTGAMRIGELRQLLRR